MALFDVITYTGPPAGSRGQEQWLVWKYPNESISLGSQLVVAPGQEVIFISEGTFADTFGPGTHALSTKNIPLLQKLVNLPFGGDTPFNAQVYFVNRVAKLDMKWGTADPIRVKDPAYDIIVPIRAYGQFGISVNDPATFLLGLVGVMPPDEITTTDRIARYFRGAVLSKVKDVIANLIVHRHVGVLDLPARLEEIGEICHERVRGEFERFGLGLVNFFVESISVPENDTSVKLLRDALAQKAATLIGAEAKKAATVMDAEAHKAEIDTLGDDRYRMKRGFDSMEKAADSKSGAGGTLVDVALGLGVAQAMAKSVSDIASEITPPATKKAVAICSACGFDNPSGARFCAGCGQKLQTGAKPCPRCKTSNPAEARFCNSCGDPLI